MARERDDLTPHRHIPHPHHPIPTARHDQPPIRRERHPPHPAPMAAELRGPALGRAAAGALERDARAVERLDRHRSTGGRLQLRQLVEIHEPLADVDERGGVRGKGQRVPRPRQRARAKLDRPVQQPHVDRHAGRRFVAGAQPPAARAGHRPLGLRQPRGQAGVQTGEPRRQAGLLGHLHVERREPLPRALRPARPQRLVGKPLLKAKRVRQPSMLAVDQLPRVLVARTVSPQANAQLVANRRVEHDAGRTRRRHERTVPEVGLDIGAARGQQLAPRDAQQRAIDGQRERHELREGDDVRIAGLDAVDDPPRAAAQLVHLSPRTP